MWNRGRNTFIFIGISLLLVFFLFQNFQSIESLQPCLEYFMDSNNPVDLGHARKKDECLRLAVADIEEHGCPKEPMMVQVVLGQLKNERGEQDVSENDNLVAQFKCQEFKTESLAVNYEGLPSQIEESTKFQTLLNNPEVKVKSQMIRLEVPSQFCPGCYTLIEQKIAEDEGMVCNESRLAVRVAQTENGIGLRISRSQSAEYQCYNKMVGGISK